MTGRTTARTTVAVELAEQRHLEGVPLVLDGARDEGSGDRGVWGLKVRGPEEKNCTQRRGLVLGAGLVGVLVALVAVLLAVWRRLTSGESTHAVNPVIAANVAWATLESPLMVSGRFSAQNCAELPIVLVANADSNQHQVHVQSDCSFLFAQHSQLIKYSIGGIQNRIELSEYLLSSENQESRTLDIGLLPLLGNSQQSLKSAIEAIDIATEMPIQNFNIQIIERVAQKTVAQLHSVDGSSNFEVKSGYFDILVSSTGYNPVKIPFTEWSDEKLKQIYMVPSNLGSSTVYLRTFIDLSSSFSVEFSSESQVCVLEKESDICDSATYFSRTQQDGSRVNLVVFQEGVFNTIEQKITLSAVKNTGRLLQSALPQFAVFGATDANFAHLAPTGKVTGRDEKVITVYTTTSRKAPDLVSKVFVDEYEPSRVENTVLSGAKILGVDQAVWYVLTTTDKKRFMIVTDGTHHPAQLYQDGGKTVVNILSAAARRHPKLGNVFATVVFADDSYLNIEDSLWDEIKKLPEILFSSALPKAAYISAGIINQHGQLYGTQLKGLVVEVEADGAYESLFTLSGPKGQAKGTIQTSAKGYKTLSFTDDSGNKDSYVFCTYALNWLITNAKYTPNLPGYSEGISPPDLRKLLLSNEEGLRSLVREVAHVTPSVFLIDTFHNAQRSFVIRSASKQAKEFSGSELESIYLKGVSTRLSHVWFNQVSIKQAKTAILKGSDVLKLDQSYLKLKIETFVQLIDTPDANSFEPQLNGVTNNQKVKDDLGLDKITLTNEVKQAIYKEGHNYAGLFVKATKPWANKFAPSVVVKEQGSLQRYYFQMDQVRAALGLEGTSSSDVKDKRTPDLFNKHRPKILAQSLCPTRATPSVAVLFRGMRKWLGEECLIALKSLEIPQAFTPENMCIAQLTEGVQYYVRIENRYYKLDFDLVEKALREDKLSAGKSSRDKVYKCLDIQIVQSDAKVLRAIPINSTDVMQGRCNGNFVPNFSCDGIWTGNHTRGHSCKLASLDRCHKYYDFVCEGKLTSKSCEGAYKRNAVVNTTELAVQSKKASVNIQRAIITGSVQLGASSQESKIDVKCDTGYDVLNKKCSLASVHTETLEKGVHTRLTVTCKGILNIETHECNMGQYDVFICSQINNKFGGEQCNGTLRKIHCENGGTLRGCAVQTPGNVDINCYGGFWDGKYCKLFPKYIITTSKHQYYTGDCQGEFEQNHFCKGLFIGTVVECPGVELKDNTNLCELPAVSNFICRGILTNKGCRGYLKTTVVVQRRKFETSITAELEPITHDYISEDSLTKMKVIPTNDSKSEEWRIRCAKSFNYVKKTCQDAVYAHDVKTSTGIINREYYVCKGILNLETLRCSDDLYSVHRCTTKFADKRFPQFCNGTYEGLLCATGGTPTACLQDDFTNVELSCVEGIWNGYSCLERPLHIILNNAAYVTGTCDGVYIENYKCKGSLEAQVILCPPGVTSDKLCRGAVVDSFTCRGLFTKEGCEGLYSGHTSLGNASLHIVSHSPIAITVHKNTSQPVKLETTGQFTLYPEVGPAGQWFGVQAACGDGFSEGANECRKTEFQGVKIAEKGEKIFYAVKCAGAFDMERLHCASGQFNGVSCQTAGDFAKNSCDGTFKNLTCANGGNFSSNCLHNEASDKVINCVGIFDGENCTAIKIEYFPIVHVSRNIWLKGTCSQKMTAGECRGIFDRASYVTCSGDPSQSREVFDACEAVPDRVFGTCDGIISSAGCKGQYSQEIEFFRFGKRKVIATNAVYDFTTISTPVNIQIQSEGAPTNKFESISCGSGFNPTSLECPKGVYKRFIEDANGQANDDYEQLNCTGVLDLKTLTCSKNTSSIESCTGRLHQETPSASLGCLGKYQYANCTTGGGLSHACTLPNLNDLVANCDQDFFDGSVCFKNLPVDYTQATVAGSEVDSVTDGGKDFKRVTINFNKVKLTGGSVVDVLKVTGVSIPSLQVNTFNDSSSGNGSNRTLTAIRASNFTQVNLTNGSKSALHFQNLDLDAVDLEKLAAICDKHKGGDLITIVIQDLGLHNIVIKKVEAHDASIQTLSTLHNQRLENLNTQNIEFGISAADIEVPQVTLNLPPITSAMIKEWKSKNTLDQTVNIPASPVRSIQTNAFQVVFRRKLSGELYPFLRLTDLTLTPATPPKISLIAASQLGSRLDYTKQVVSAAAQTPTTVPPAPAPAAPAPAATK